MVKKQTNIFSFMVDIFTKNIDDNIKDHRRDRGDIKYSFTDIILSAFSIFYFQSPSWLSFQTKMQSSKGSNNAFTMFGITNIPSDNHIRNILDKIKPESLKSVYEEIVLKAESLGILQQFVFMKKYLLVALDGTHYHSSKKISCKCCQTKKDKDTGIIHFFHSCITPTIVHPKSKKVIALMQEFISNDDGNDKQDCEVNASKRWLDKFNILKKYKLIILGDDLYSRQPMIEKVLEKCYSYIFVCKKESHKILYEYVNMIKNLKTNESTKISKMVNGVKQIFTYNYINEVPLN